MDNLLDNNWLVPVLAASAFVVTLFDMAAYLTKRSKPASSKDAEVHTLQIHPGIGSSKSSDSAEEKRHSSSP